MNFKGADDTAGCVDSLMSSAESLGIVVVDNTPDDPDLEPVLAPYPDVRLIRAQANLGFGRGNNLGIDWSLQHTDCEFVFVLNNDTIVEPGSIFKLEKAMDAHPEAGIVTPRIVLAEDSAKLWYGGGDVDWRRGGGRVPGFLGPADAPSAMRSRQVSFASGCAMLVRRRVLEVCGGFDPIYFMYEEDVDLSLRVSKKYAIYYEANAVIYHKGQGSQRKVRTPFHGKWIPDNPNYAFHVYHMTRNAVINGRKHAKGKDKAIWLFFYPLFLLKKAMSASMKLGVSAHKPVVRGVVDGMRVNPDEWMTQCE